MLYEVITGRLITTPLSNQTVLPGDNNFRISLPENIPSGVYILKVDGKLKSEYEIIVKDWYK